jgi:hypothetical protein
LPLSLGLQIILFHNLREGIKMRWSHDLEGEPSASVDIASQIQLALQNADKSHD